MYKLNVKGNEFTIPKQNIILLAMSKQMEQGLPLSRTEDEALNFFKRNGITVEEV